MVICRILYVWDLQDNEEIFCFQSRTLDRKLKAGNVIPTARYERLITYPTYPDSETYIGLKQYTLIKYYFVISHFIFYLFILH